MAALEEYTNFARTVTELLRDGEELGMIEKMVTSINEAKRLKAEEETQLNHEITRLLEQLESYERKKERKEPKEMVQKEIEEVQRKQKLCLKNITNLQEERLQIQQKINTIKQSPCLELEKAKIRKEQEAHEVEKQKLRLYMNAFKCLNWDLDVPHAKGFVTEEKLQSFDFESSASYETANELWKLL